MMARWPSAWSWLGVYWFSPDVPKNREPTPAIDQAAADAAEAEARTKARTKKGKAATVLTSPTGAQGAQLGDSGQPGATALGDSGNPYRNLRGPVTFNPNR